MNEVNADVANLSVMEAIYETYSGQPGALIPILQKAQMSMAFCRRRSCSGLPIAWT